MALNYDELHATTQDHMRKMVEDNIKNEDPLLKDLLEKKVLFNGTKFVQPIKHARLNGGAYSVYDGTNDFNIEKKETHTAAEFGVKGIYANSTIDGFEQIQNKNREQVVDLMKEKAKDLSDTLRELYSRTLLSTQAGQFEGLDKVYAQDNVYGGIDRATNAFWKAKLSANGGTDRALTLKMLNQMWTQTTRGGQDHKGLRIVVGFDVWDKIYDLIEEKYRKVDTKEVTKVGQRAIIFNGTPILISPYVSDNDIRFVNTDHFFPVHQDGRDFYLTPFKEKQDNDTLVRQMFVSGNFALSKASSQGIIKDIDPTL